MARNGSGWDLRGSEAAQQLLTSTALTEQSKEARRSAVIDLELLLQHPEDLKRLPALREEVAMKQQANKAALSASMSSQTESLRGGMERVTSSQVILVKLQEHFREINALCAECSSLIENHEKIQLLSMVHYNLGKTLEDVENIAALPAEAAAAEAMLQDDYQLLQAYECLATLEGTSTLAQQALVGMKTLNRDELRNLSVYFDRVKDTMCRFEERLWSIVRNFIVLGRTNPALLVSAVRVVEMQETVDRQISASVPDAGITRKAYRRRCENHIGMCIEDTFAPLLQSCSSLAAAGADTNKKTDEILGQAALFVEQLADIYDYVSPCFPPKYDIFKVIFRKYHEHLSFVLDCVGACSESLANSDILKVMAWVATYQDTCRELGIEDDELRLPAEAGRGISTMVDRYTQRVHGLLTTWHTNILEADLKAEPRQAEDGRLWTPGAVDFFRTVNEQLSVVEEYTAGGLLLRTAQAAIKAMKEFQEAQRLALMRMPPLGVDLLCALANNNSRCYDESLEFAEHLQQILPPGEEGQLDVEEACRGFLELAKAACGGICASIFSDGAFAELFYRMYAGSEDWVGGRLTGTIVATLEDYLDEYQQYILPSFFKRLSEACLEETVAHLVAALLLNTRTLSDDAVARMDADAQEISRFFAKSQKPERVAMQCQALVDLKVLAASDSLEGFVLSYSTLLESAPGVTPALLERLVSARPDIARSNAREVMEQCREMYMQRQRQVGDEPVGSSVGRGIKSMMPASQGKTAFGAALMAARRRAMSRK